MTVSGSNTPRYTQLHRSAPEPHRLATTPQTSEATVLRPTNTSAAQIQREQDNNEILQGTVVSSPNKADTQSYTRLSIGDFENEYAGGKLSGTDKFKTGVKATIGAGLAIAAGALLAPFTFGLSIIAGVGAGLGYAANAARSASKQSRNEHWQAYDPNLLSAHVQAAVKRIDPATVRNLSNEEKKQLKNLPTEFAQAAANNRVGKQIEILKILEKAGHGVNLNDCLRGGESPVMATGQRRTPHDTTWVDNPPPIDDQVLRKRAVASTQEQQQAQQAMASSQGRFQNIYNGPQNPYLEAAGTPRASSSSSPANHARTQQSEEFNELLDSRLLPINDD